MTYKANENSNSLIAARFTEYLERLTASEKAIENEQVKTALNSLITDMLDGHVCTEISLDQAKQLKEYSFVSLSATDSLHTNADQNADLSNNKINESTGLFPKIQPLILDMQHGDAQHSSPSYYLYLRKYYEYELLIAKDLLDRARSSQIRTDSQMRDNAIDSLLEILLPDTIQKSAARKALQNRLLILTGGPGTGKTTTVAKILFLLYKSGIAAERMAIAAPTGKAARRLKESMKAAAITIEKDLALIQADQVKQEQKPPDESLPDFAGHTSTLHRLLRPRADGTFRHNAENPLDIDALILDEASMIDTLLFSRTLEALPATASLIIVGDEYQLASVESGAVLSSLCDELSPIQNNIVRLKTNYRFQTMDTADRTNQNKNERSVAEAQKAIQDLNLQNLHTYTSDLSQLSQLKTMIINRWQEFCKTENPEDSLEKFDHFRILCAHRHGQTGVYSINDFAIKALYQANLLQPAGNIFDHMPIMITMNDYNLGLMNGDTGIILRTSSGLRAYFPGSDGSMRSFSPVRLPQYELCFAMTIHKSQGSEYQHIAVLLPEKESEILRRELLYTAVTRAKSSVHIFGPEAIIEYCLMNQTRRKSGLLRSMYLLRNHEGPRE